MKINIILPELSYRPKGGYRFFYECANILSKKGHNITIIYCYNFSCVPINWYNFIRLIFDKIFGPIIIKRWYNLNNSIKIKYIPFISNLLVPNADVIVATWWPSSYDILRLKDNKGNKFYVVFEIERHRKSFSSQEYLVLKSYKLPIAKITISENTNNELKSLNVSRIINIEKGNGISNKFKIVNPIHARGNTIGAIIHKPFLLKRPMDAIKSFDKIACRNNNVRFFVASSVFNKNNFFEWLRNENISSNLINRIEFLQKPNDHDLIYFYNNLSIFVFSSIYEGFGLIGAEALACGCALVTTDSGGIRDYAINNKTALVSSPCDIDKLVNNVSELLIDKERRIRLAEEGAKFVKQFDFKRTSEKLLAVFNSDFLNTKN